MKKMHNKTTRTGLGQLAINPVYCLKPDSIPNKALNHQMMALTLSQTSPGFYVSAVQVF